MVLALVTVALLPLAVVSHQLVGMNRQAMVDQVLRTHALAARSAAARVEAFLASLRGPASAVAANPRLYEDPRSEVARELLAGYLQAQPAVAAVAITNPQGVEFIRVQNRGLAEIATRVLAVPFRPGAAHVLDRSGSWVRLEVELPEQVGRLRLVASAAALRDVVLSEELGQEALLLVATAEGDVIAGPAGVTTLGDFPPDLVAAARTGQVSGASRYGGKGDEGVLGAFAPLPEVGWFVVAQQPVRVAEALAREARRRSLLAIGGALGLTGVLCALAWHGVVRPIRALALAQRRAAGMRGGGRAGSEIQDLAQSFAVLERQMRERDRIGEVFLGRYLVVGVVGEGGMGTVFRGYDPKLQRPVALKTVRFAALGQQSEARREAARGLVREAVTVARFSHPNIVAVYDVQDIPEVAFIAMEYVDGVSLERYLGRQGALGAGQTVALGLAIAHGLAAAHAHGVVHHDVKPGNVLLGRDGAIKVTDFGLAGLGPNLPVSADQVLGTPGYLPPEALRGEEYDAPGDAFSLGVILYRAVAGVEPFDGWTMRDVIDATLEKEPPPLAGAAVILAPVVMGLLEKDPRHRLSLSSALVQLDALQRGGGFAFEPAPSAFDPARAGAGFPDLGSTIELPGHGRVS